MREPAPQFVMSPVVLSNKCKDRVDDEEAGNSPCAGSQKCPCYKAAERKRILRRALSSYLTLFVVAINGSGNCRHAADALPVKEKKKGAWRA
jgi:hypothetical protein